jgi:hypothetical protein
VSVRDDSEGSNGNLERVTSVGDETLATSKRAFMGHVNAQLSELSNEQRGDSTKGTNT